MDGWMDSFPGGREGAHCNERNRDRVARQFKLLKHSVSLPSILRRKVEREREREREKRTGAMREHIFAVLTALFDMWVDSHLGRNQGST